MLTMKDVAKEAGVSLGTVSNVLNNLPSVSLENRQKVLDAIDKLKFIPNTAARSLKTRKSNSIGLIIPDINNPFYPELARGAEDEAKKSGYNIFLCNNDRDVDKEREYIKTLIEKTVDGIILVKPRIRNEELDEITKICNVVLIDASENESSGYDIINVNDYAGAKKAMELLYDHGHIRIAYISGLGESFSSRCRQQAYLDFLCGKNIPLNESWIKKGKYDWSSGYFCTVEILKQADIPTAILASNDLMAIGAMKAVREHGLKIPQDISVMGFDDISMCELCTPQLTTIQQPKYQLGKLGVEILVNKNKSFYKSMKKEGNTVTLETNVIMRESVSYAKRI